VYLLLLVLNQTVEVGQPLIQFLHGLGNKSILRSLEFDVDSDWKHLLCELIPELQLGHLKLYYRGRCNWNLLNQVLKDIPRIEKLTVDGHWPRDKVKFDDFLNLIKSVRIDNLKVVWSPLNTNQVQAFLRGVDLQHLSLSAISLAYYIDVVAAEVVEDGQVFQIKDEDTKTRNSATRASSTPSSFNRFSLAFGGFKSLISPDLGTETNTLVRSRKRRRGKRIRTLLCCLIRQQLNTVLTLAKLTVDGFNFNGNAS